MSATLYLIPNTLGESALQEVLPEENLKIMRGLRCFFVENIRNARRFLISAGMPVPIDRLTFMVLSRHSSQADIESCLHVLLMGNDAGIISEAGMPAIADPGAPLVRLAHLHGIRVRPLTGPSSIALALAASGLNGQSFAFHGYLPIPAGERNKAIRSLERESEERNLTQAFMETPYRNMALLESLIRTCRPDTLLCVACDLTLKTEYIRTQTVGQWKKNLPDLHKRPSIFLLYRQKKNS